MTHNFKQRTATLEEDQRLEGKGRQVQTRSNVGHRIRSGTNIPHNQAQRYQSNHPKARDRDNRIICIDDRDDFLTTGKFNSSQGMVYKISRNGDSVTSRDSLNYPISRAPDILRVIDEVEE